MTSALLDIARNAERLQQLLSEPDRTAVWYARVISRAAAIGAAIDQHLNLSIHLIDEGETIRLVAHRRPELKCEICGCTEENACVDLAGDMPADVCGWVNLTPPVCSFCVIRQAQKDEEAAKAAAAAAPSSADHAAARQLMAEAMEEGRAASDRGFRMPCYLSYETATAIVSAVHLALRHPKMPAGVKLTAQTTVDELVRIFEAEGMPKTAALLKLGELEAYDVDS